MEFKEPTYSEGKSYDTLCTEWLPKFLKKNTAWIDSIYKPFVDNKGQDWNEFLDFVVQKEYKYDEV